MILRDFHCTDCNESFEEYLASSTDRLAPCPKCGQPCEMVLSVPQIGAFSMSTPAQQSETLRKRSHEHTIREMKKEPERHGFAAADSRPWNRRSHKSST